MIALRRTPVMDELLLDEELVVLVEHRVILLSPLASYALTWLRQDDDWIALDDLSAALVEEFGAPDEPDAVAGLVDALVDEGLLERARDERA